MNNANIVIVKRVFSFEGLLSTAVYLALGLGLFLWIGDFTVFSWGDPYLYAYALLWPFILIYHFLKWALIAAILVGIVFLGVRLAR